MLKLNASYSKKVPAEGEYTSQSYHCSMELELSDKLEPDEIQAKIHETFALVRDAVEVELHGETAPVRTPMRVVRQPEAAPARPTPPTGEKASNKQVKYILDLAKAQGLGLTQLNARVQQAYRAASVYDLDRKSASQLVDELKAAA